MSAPRILSKSQILALESCYLFLRTLRPLLLSIGNESLSDVTRVQLDNVATVALLNQTRLVTSFAEIAAAQKRWGC